MNRFKYLLVGVALTVSVAALSNVSHADAQGSHVGRTKTNRALPAAGEVTGTTFDLSKLPACVPVSDKTGAIRGCVDHNLVDDIGDDSPKAGEPGLPVLDKPNGQLVGYFVDEWGFVDAKTASDPAVLKTIISCAVQLHSPVRLSDSCRTILTSQGLSLP